jgi:hypothetical protein
MPSFSLALALSLSLSLSLSLRGTAPPQRTRHEGREPPTRVAETVCSFFSRSTLIVVDPAVREVIRYEKSIISLSRCVRRHHESCQATTRPNGAPRRGGGVWVYVVSGSGGASRCWSLSARAPVRPSGCLSVSPAPASSRRSRPAPRPPPGSRPAASAAHSSHPSATPSHIHPPRTRFLDWIFSYRGQNTHTT